MPLTKAVFPVAGLGTRFLPATKANPKEMLPIVDKPLIQYAVEEAISAGVTELIFVTSSSKRAIEDHFDRNVELETILEKQDRQALLSAVRDIVPEGVHCVYLRQSEPLGLGHAVLCAANVVGDEPFAVLLADDLIKTVGDSCLKQMLSVYESEPASLLAVQEVSDSDVSKYGIVDVQDPNQSCQEISGIIEKPSPEKAPSRLGVVGRYILQPSIFSYLRETKRGAGGEIQLTDAIAAQSASDVEKVKAYRFDGVRYDCGSKLGYLEATMAYALAHPEVGEDFRKLVLGLGELLS